MYGIVRIAKSSSVEIYSGMNRIAEASWTENSFDYSPSYNNVSADITDAKSFVRYYVGDIYENCKGMENNNGWYFKNATVRLTSDGAEIITERNMPKKQLKFKK